MAAFAFWKLAAQRENMRRLRLHCFLGCLLLALLLIPALWLFFGGSRKVTLANFQKIHVGMTEDEVDLLLIGHTSRDKRIDLQVRSAVEAAICDEAVDKEFHDPTWKHHASTYGRWYQDDDGSWLLPGPSILVIFSYSNEPYVVVDKYFAEPTVSDCWQRVRGRLGW
jgi:hypothetical protein